MKLYDAVTLYIARRRSEGAPFHSTEVLLRAFCKRCADIDVQQLTTHHIHAYVQGNTDAASTRLSKFSAAKNFIKYWNHRGEMPALRLVKPPARPRPPEPFIYTVAQIRSLLEATDECQRGATKISGESLRAIILALYATGLPSEQLLRLRRSSVSLKRKTIVLGSGRVLPIGSDLAASLARYVAGAPRGSDLPFFHGGDADEISRDHLSYRFKRLHILAGISPEGDAQSPRLQNLRFTFAVHKLTAWIGSHADMNRLVPALSTYMGYANLTKAEQFLAFAPERFRNDLQKLSPQRGRKHWRDKPELLNFIESL